METDAQHRTVTVDDRRGGSIFVRDWGPEDSAAVIHHHGTPSCSLAVPTGWSGPSNHGVRVVTFDRPGYGQSTNRPGRSMSEAAVWTEIVADALGIERFAVMGTSGGGPHAAAAAAVLPDRVTRLCISVGVGPTWLEGFDVSQDMLAETRQEIDAARDGEQALRTFIDHVMSADPGLDQWLNQLPPSDVEILGRDDVKAEERAEADAWGAHGIEGWLEDDLAIFARPWNVDLSSITAATLLVYGASDVLVPPTHGDAYHRAIPHAQCVKVEGGGHWMRDHEPAIIRWLTSDRDVLEDLATRT